MCVAVFLKLRNQIAQMNGSLLLQWHTFLITCILSGERERERIALRWTYIVQSGLVYNEYF